MFEQFRETQAKFCQEMDRLLENNNRVSHAYLIETNSFTKSRELVFAFAKLLLCPNINDLNHNDKECVPCLCIEKNEYPDLVVIEPDGSWIKKEQVLTLQAKLKTKSYTGGRRVYIIFQAEKLNKSSANTLLKFLEEPEVGITAILVTNNRYQLLNTILSRCQVLSFVRDDVQTTTSDIDYKDYILFLNTIYKKGPKVLCKLNELWYSKFKTKSDYIEVVGILEKIYQDLLECQDQLDFLKEKYGSDIESIFEYISVEDIVSKIRVIQEYKNRLIYNVNLKLWVDSFVIELSK